ncbi:MAG TPA: NADH-quinone oxidoreductase subunit J [Syntrophomonadaceae bacterium]|nr:NADH-quinone oxidoreductase subunit J [Syntrophomonadaceae bacterium]HQE24030.1 NADH-quinone oxidoreductase subunit J [Syntrophomonadaceae bacterium]
MNMNDAVFIILGFITLLGAVGVVSFTNIVHAALSLVMSFLGVAGLYFQLQAEFLGLVQIMVYAGAISVLIIFAIMLVMDRDPDQTNVSHKVNRWWGGLIALLFAAFIGFAIRESHFTGQAASTGADRLGQIAELVLGNYVIAFEVAAILLLVAVVGAIILAKGAKEQ